MTRANDFIAHLELTSYGRRDDTWILALSVRDPTKQEWIAAGRNILAAPGMEDLFGKHEALVAIDDAGTVRTVWYRPHVPVAFRRMIDPLILARDHDAGASPERPSDCTLRDALAFR